MRRLQRRKRSGIRMTELSLSQKYADAFWRLVPIPALLIVAAIIVGLRPSPLAIAGLIALAWASLFAEVLVWRHLRHRWAQGLAPESVGQTLEELGRPAQTAIAVALLFGAWTLKAQGIRGGSWGDAALFALAMIPVYAVLLLIVATVLRAWEHFMQSFGGGG